MARFRRAAVSIAFVALLMAAAVLFPRVPNDTSTSTLLLRLSIGLGVGSVVIIIVARSLKALTQGAPAEPPNPVDANEVDVVYTCVVCGTKVRLELAGTAKAPRHCGENMAPTVEASPKSS